MSHSHARRRYLTAKQSVDDRARSRRVRARMCNAVAEQPTVVEAGCGVGNSVASLLDWGISPASYRGVDADPDIVAFARSFLPKLLRRRGDAARETADGCLLGGEADEVPVTFQAADALTALPGADAELLIAQSFLDLVPLQNALDAISGALAPGGFAYAPLTFDGVTLFQPEHPGDEQVIAAYHGDIDGTPGRDSRAGRRLIDRLRDREEALLAVAASDWIVRPVDGQYRDDERYFLACILEFVAEAIEGVDCAEDWLTTRREQLSSGALTFIAHGYDLLWQRPR
ncbi:MAG: class I SAM-dependent methyltransferase [Halolamina sp.]|uniref:class I SAM-dependent methyltransferase n=1 Tax=Halolamina sp. TaxID=1940283 RepID=UPI002FC32B5B